MNTRIEQYNRLTMSEEQKIYDHLLHCVQVESPSKMLERFRTLFLTGLNYSDPDIRAALDKIVGSSFAEQDFKLFLNRCCYILINRWQSRPQFQDAIPQLIALLARPSSATAAGLGRTRSLNRLRQLMQFFAQSEQYQRLRRLAEFMTQASESLENTKPLVTLLRRYPYLYHHCLVSEDSDDEHQRNVRQAQKRAQKQFEVDLSQYLTYELRCFRSPSKVIQPVRNPTLLSSNALHNALKIFAGKVNGSGSYRDIAQRFLIHANQAKSYKVFKDDFYDYLTTSVDTKFGRCRFNNQLHTYLAKILTQSNSQKFSDFLFVRTCSQVLNFLVIESAQNPNHYVFMDLITNIGATGTMGLLLKIVLVCKKVKPYLEKRFSILFNHYESHSRSNVQWLINCLENLNVAWSAHFGTTDFSYVNQMV